MALGRWGKQGLDRKRGRGRAFEVNEESIRKNLQAEMSKTFCATYKGFPEEMEGFIWHTYLGRSGGARFVEDL